MRPDQAFAEFFTAGGTLPANAPSYVKRSTDDELFRHLMAGEFCYVLTPRQMGKSSLMIRTAQRLKEEGVTSAIVDLTQIGTVTSEDQWYKGILSQIKRRLRLTLDPVTWWENQQDIPNIQKFIEFFEEALSEIPGYIVIFMDEIDTTLKLEFRDNFFAGIRAFYNARAENPEFKRLTFTLLGVASPSDLIKDRTRTPFNVGQEILLRPFNRKNAYLLEKGLEEKYPEFGRKILDRIFYWTNGHPYLTQKLCQSIVENELDRFSDKKVDVLVEKLFISEEASRETNLQFVRDNVLNYPQRKEILALYRRLLLGKKEPENKSSLAQNQLKLSGLAIVDNGMLVVSNRIYQKVFDRKWAEKYTEANWLVILTSILGLTVMALAYVIYNDAIALPRKAQRNIDNLAIYKDDRGILYLAELFQMKPYIFPNEYEYKAKDTFFNLFSSWEEQKTLIEIAYGEPHPPPNMYKVVITGLYTSLADVDNSGETTKLLDIMYRSLEEMGMQNDVIYQELGYWLAAKKSANEKNFDVALDKYNQAINLNPKNPATLFERARILVQLKEYENALKDYEQVIAIVPESSIEPTEIPPSNSNNPSGSDAGTTGTPSYLSATSPSSNATALAETPVELANTSTISTPGTTATPILLPTQSIDPIILRTPTAQLPVLSTPEVAPPPVKPLFLTLGQRAAAVRNDLNQNRDMNLFLSQVDLAEYPNLSNYGIASVSPTPTAINATVPASETTPVAPISELLSVPYTPTALYVNTPHSPLTSDLYRGVQAAYQRGDWEEVISGLEEIIQIEPDGADAYYYMGEAYRFSGDTNNSISSYQRAIELDPTFAAPYVGIARARLAADSNADVIELLNQAIQLDPNFGEAYIERAIVELRGNNIPSAVADLAQADQLLPSSPLVFFHLAQTRLQAGEYELALDAAKRANELDVTHLPTYLLLGSIYTNLDNEIEAVRALEIYVKYDQSNFNALSLLATSYYRLGQYEKALEQFVQALNIARVEGNRAREGTTLSNIGSVYAELGQLTQALDYQEQALNIAEEIGDRSMESAILRTIGRVYMQQNEYPQALVSYQQALEIALEIGDRVGEMSAVYDVGQIYMQLGQFARAIDYYQKALDMARQLGAREQESFILYSIGLAYAELGRLDQALSYYDEALKIAQELGLDTLQQQILEAPKNLPSSATPSNQ